MIEYKIKRFLFLALLKINYFFIPILLFLKGYKLIYLLLRLNLRKIKNISPKEKKKSKVIVLKKSGGLEDLIDSQKKYNKYIDYYLLPRAFIKAIFKYYIKKEMVVEDYNYYFNKSIEVKERKKKYREALIKIISILKNKFGFNAFISFNFNYYAERELHAACKALNIKFIVLHKESIFSPNEEKVIKNIYKNYSKKFEGYKIATYSNNERNFIVNAKVASKNQVKVIGCPRLDKCFLMRKIKPKKKVVYYMVEDQRGLPNEYFRYYDKTFRKQFKFYNDVNYKKLNWIDLRKKTTDTLIELAKKNKNIEFIFKGKVGVMEHSKENLPSLPPNCKVILGGTGEQLLKDAKLIIGWNSTVILEAIAANRRVLIPYFGLKKNFFAQKFEIDFKLNLKNKGINDQDFKKKFFNFIKKPYNKNKNNNSLSSVKQHLGNVDGKSEKRLDQFINECLKI